MRRGKQQGQQGPSVVRQKANLGCYAKNLFACKSASPVGTVFFRNLSLVAFFAWGSLGSDGFSLSCFGAGGNVVLGEQAGLVLLVGLVSALTILAIGVSLPQASAPFPSIDSGSRAVSKPLPPALGMVSSCALLVVDVLTIALCVVIGADALFRILPLAWQGCKLPAEVLGVLLLVVFSPGGAKGTVPALVPAFVVFVLTHAVAVISGLGTHPGNLPTMVLRTATRTPLGLVVMVLLILRAYGICPGTMSGTPGRLCGPTAQKGRPAMACLAVSLSVTVMGLILASILFGVAGAKDTAMNAMFFADSVQSWGVPGQVFVLVALASEAAVLFLVAQTGFIDGPRRLADMAASRWLPMDFTMLSDPLAVRTGVRLMGGAALALMVLTHGSAQLLIVFYTINLLIAFALAQLGLLRHWLGAGHGAVDRRKGLVLHGSGFVLSCVGLVLAMATNFAGGGWTALLISGALVALTLTIREHYGKVSTMLKKLDALLPVAEADAAFLAPLAGCAPPRPAGDSGGETAVILVNGYNGLGLHTLSGIHRIFAGGFENFIFVQVGMADSSVFRSVGAVERLESQARADLGRYVDLMRSRGLHAEGVCSVGVDVAEEIVKLASQIRQRFPKAIFFGGRLAFPNETVFTRLLHNRIVFAVQRRLNRQGAPMLLVPIRLLAS